jgi:hypothetical protein
MVNTEYETENYQDVEKIKGVLNKLGVKVNVNFGKNFYGEPIFKKDFNLSI